MANAIQRMRRQGGDVLCHITFDILCHITATRESTRPPCTHTCAPVHIVTKDSLACKNSRFSSLLATGRVQRRGTSATQRQKFHIDLTTVFCQRYTLVSFSDSAKALGNCRLRKCVQQSVPWRWKPLPCSECVFAVCYLFCVSYVTTA